MGRDSIVKHSQQVSITIFLVTIVSFLGYSSIFATSENRTLNFFKNHEKDPASGHYRLTKQDSPTETIIVNLPIIEQNAQATPEPVGGASDDIAEIEAETDPGTPTPTPIPVQRGSTNLPIVVGALAIIIVIILAWFFVGYLPSRNRE